MVATSTYGVGIGSGYGGDCGDITIHFGTTVIATGKYGAGIGSGQIGRCGDIIIYSGANVIAASKSGAGIGSGYQGYCESVTYPSTGINASKIGDGISSRNKTTLTLTDDEEIFDSYIREIETTETVSTTTTVNTTTTVSTTTTVNTTTFVNTTTVVTSTVTVPTTTTLTETAIVPTTTTLVTTSTGLVTSTIVTTSTKQNNAYFQWGARSNQSTALNINDMHTKSLRGEVPSRTDTERLNAMDSDSAEYSSFMATLKAASNLTLDDISVGTRENANVAICVINGALEYALDVSTTLGAHSKRMEFAAYNVTTMAENVRASESVIRDTDMASAMTGYTKANVLRQAAQSMLAQANQNSSNVLSLLRS